MAKDAPMVTFLHNPNSPLSRRALGTVAHDADLEIIDVIETVPEAAELTDLVRRLPVAARELLDRSGALYFALGLDDPRWTDAEVMAAAFDNPSLLRCPILIAADEVRLEDGTLAPAAGRRDRDLDDAPAPVLADHG